jgi:CheY-like chemotaxis protein
MVLEYLNMVDILLLEDEPADAYLVKMALKEGKVSVNLHHVLDGREGMDFLQKKDKYKDAPRPDLIFLDLNMPRMNGYEFLKVIKSNPMFSDIPVVVLTTSDVENDVVRTYELGVAGFVTKPVDMVQFTSAIHQIEDYWFTLARLPKGLKL